jgi:hypothetical protein
LIDFLIHTYIHQLRSGGEAKVALVRVWSGARGSNVTYLHNRVNKGQMAMMIALATYRL